MFYVLYTSLYTFYTIILFVSVHIVFEDTYFTCFVATLLYFWFEPCPTTPTTCFIIFLKDYYTEVAAAEAWLRWVTDAP